MPKRSEAIKSFLSQMTHNDLANLYNAGMECQVNVAQDGGERVDGDFKGRRWHGWTDGLTTWKPFRLPLNASSNPTNNDYEIKFDLAQHVESIGMTGWDWQNQCSKWVAYDFDAIIGHDDKHSAKLTNEELEAVKTAAHNIEWVTIRKSTSGRGLHLYVFLDNVPTQNHNEHSALARAILGTMAALTGFNFHSKVDIRGGNMWIWHRKMTGTDGLSLIKQGTVLKEIPANWRDHISVVTRKRRKNLPQDIEQSSKVDFFEELCGRHPKIPLDEQHQQLINFLKDTNALWWWDQDNYMLVTHTIHLQEAHEALKMQGFFKTISKGTERGQDHNCFAFPLRNGAWSVRRYTPGVHEHDSWDQDGAGWTNCYFNRTPDLRAACKAYGGIEDPSGGFVFREAEIAIKAARLLGVSVDIDTPLAGRKTRLKQHKDGRLITEIDREPTDRYDTMSGWLPKSKIWTQIYRMQATMPHENEIGTFDDIIRHIVAENQDDQGWTIKTENRWCDEPLAHVKAALGSLGFSGKDITGIVGSSIFRHWTIVNKPFQPEYPGDRQWNRQSAQLRFMPTNHTDNLLFPTWLKILEHCGDGLTNSVKQHPWCKANGILTGAEWLKCWIASLFQEPTEPLPYLFFYGPQNSGKSILHEALSLLLTKGYRRADAALISSAGFNAEIDGALVCVIEETNLHKNASAERRIKDWVTSRDLLIHRKGYTPYHVRNTTHWIQCDNDHRACPIFPGDTRITMCFTEEIPPMKLIPKKRIIDLLEREASDFVSEVINLELPESTDRLNIPVIVTEDKTITQQLNQTSLEMFLVDKCKSSAGYRIKFSELYEQFQKYLEADEVGHWSKIRMGKELPPQYPKARSRKDGQFYIGNIAWKITDTTVARPKLTICNGFLDSMNP
jgi:hypothetical protein